MSEQRDEKGQQKKTTKVEQQKDGACGSRPEESNQEKEGLIKDEELDKMLDCLAFFGTRKIKHGREIEPAKAERLGKSVSEIYKAIDDTSELNNQFTSVASIIKQYNDERERVEKERTTLVMKKKESICEEKLNKVLEYYKCLTTDQNRKLDDKLHKTRKLEQLYFADRVFDTLIGSYGIRLSRNPREKDDIFKMSVAKAVIGISMIHRDQWREFFYAVKKRMLQRENFLAYCYMVPVENYGPYFYSVLQRIAVIFEMALFCYEHGYNYFGIAVNCISRFFDVEFFVKAGDWARLHTAADIVFILTFPLIQALDCEKGGLKSFSDVIKELVAVRAIDKSGPEYLLFQELNEIFEYKSTKKFNLPGTSCQKRDSPKRKNVSKDMSDSVSKRDGREILVNYFKKRLPRYFPETPDKTGLNLKTGEDYILDLESWIFHETTHKNKQEVAEVQKLLSELNLDSESKKSPSKGIRSPHKASPSGLQTKSPKAETGARPKRSPKSKVKYVRLQTDHVEELVELYQNTFPSFLKTYLHECFIPKIEGNSCLFNIEGSCFIMPTDLMLERKKIEIQKTRSQKRLWGKSPLDFACAMPIQIERMLDMYIMNDHYTVFNIGQAPSLSFIGPDDKKKPWRIRSTLDEFANPFTAGSKAMTECNDLLRNLKDDTHNIIGADFETIRRLSMAEETVNAELPTSETVESESPRRRKNKGKKRSKR